MGTKMISIPFDLELAKKKNNEWCNDCLDVTNTKLINK